ncbi:Uncharacterised protein [Chlamydia trachomatis]|nr:Uncharacterised protein [Chlamydia trachomatis]
MVSLFANLRKACTSARASKFLEESTKAICAVIGKLSSSCLDPKIPKTPDSSLLVKYSSLIQGLTCLIPIPSRIKSKDKHSSNPSLGTTSLDMAVIRIAPTF